jgi:nucleotide-binding universal stress UspA family protein
VIPWVASNQQVNLIVMGTICRTGLPGLFIGSTAENVLQQVDCSVLTAQPGGFVSPVKLGDS